MLSRDVVHAALRANLPFIGIASVTFVAGGAFLLLSLLRSRDRMLLWLGVFSVLYALRLFADNELIQAAISVDDTAVALWILCLTYVIPIPLAFFARELLGESWRKVTAIWIQIQIVFAAITIPLTLLGYHGEWIDYVNAVLVISGTLLVLMYVARKSNDGNSFARSLTWPLSIFGVLILLRNFGFRPAGLNIEPFGFLILLAGMGVTASRHALASERKLLEMEQELATARRIQDSILPRSSPELQALRLAARYQPMTAVAGDFYDFAKLGDAHLTILVADVSGHGVPAALVASMLKVCFAALREKARDPASVLTGLNVMLRDSLGGQYVTAACASIDTHEKIITYSGAGHPPALLLRRQAGSVVPLLENGLFIGPFPQASYANLSISFQPGDRLLLYTDGIPEATARDGEEFGQERLAAFLIATADLPPQQLIERLFQEIATSSQQDDQTALLAHFD